MASSRSNDVDFVIGEEDDDEYTDDYSSSSSGRRRSRGESGLGDSYSSSTSSRRGSQRSIIGSYKIPDKSIKHQGGFGKVLEGIHEKTGEKVAIKKLEFNNNGDIKMALSEIKVFTKLSEHPYIADILDYYFEDGAFWIILPYYTPGDVQNYCKRNKINTDFIMMVLHESANALRFMHSRDPQIIHRDIKPGNILLTDANGDLSVRITDFGISKIMEQSISRGYIGTPGYMAPELCSSFDYDTRVDIFSLGQALVWMLKQVSDKGKDYRYLCQLKERMTEQDPRKRISLEEVEETMESTRGIYLRSSAAQRSKSKPKVKIEIDLRSSNSKSKRQSKPDENDRIENYSPGDVVEIKPGFKYDGMRALVTDSLSDGTLNIHCLNGKTLKVSRNVIRKFNNLNKKIEKGDCCFIIDEENVVKIEQKGHGEWCTSMTKALGVPGIITQCLPDKNMYVIDVNRRNWPVNKSVVRLFAKKDELSRLMPNS